MIKFDSTVTDNVSKSDYSLIGKYVQQFIIFHNIFVSNSFDSKFLDFIAHGDYSFVGNNLRSDFYASISNHYPDYDVRFIIEDSLIVGAKIFYIPF